LVAANCGLEDKVKRFWLYIYKLAAEHLRRYAQPARRPTISELERILYETDEPQPEVVHLPDGSVIAV
jgi:hypothetical protein